VSPPECLDRIDALADKHRIDRDVARRLAAALDDYDEASRRGSRTTSRWLIGARYWPRAQPLVDDGRPSHLGWVEGTAPA
jgi:hypothetical protein